MSNIVVHEHNVSDIERMARAIAASKLFGITQPEQAITLCLIAQAEGRHPASAAQDYHIIQGRPAKKADAMLRDFLSGGGKVKWHALDDTIADATFSHPAGGEVRISWDMERAKNAKLATDMWKKYPRQMLRSRTVSEGVRTVYPMATSGMYVPEEVQEFEAPREPAQQAQVEVPMIEGTVSEPATPAAGTITPEEANALFATLENNIRSAANVDDLGAVWKHDQPDRVRLPREWISELGVSKDQRKAELTRQPGEDMGDDIPFGDRDFVPPNFESMPA